MNNLLTNPVRRTRGGRRTFQVGQWGDTMGQRPEGWVRMGVSEETKKVGKAGGL